MVPNLKTSGILLSKHDVLCALEIIHASTTCATEDAFRQMVLSLRALIPFEYAACLMGRKSGTADVTTFDAINISYPAEWSMQYVAQQYHLVDPVFKVNFTTFPLQYWGNTYKQCPPPKQFLREAEDVGLRRGYSIGQRNLDLSEGSLLSFGGLDVRKELRTEMILHYVTPHLHQAFIRLLRRKNDRRPAALSEREQEILSWAKEGKSTWEISVIMGISQNTVKFHMKNIFIKLNANSRSHAVAIALDNKLIEF